MKKIIKKIIANAVGFSISLLWLEPIIVITLFVAVSFGELIVTSIDKLIELAKESKQ